MEERFAGLLAGAADPALVRGTAEAARARSPQVAALPEEEVRRHVTALVEAAAEALASGRDVAGADLEAAERLGADRARQGVPVAALLDGFQAGRAHLVATVVDRGRRAGLPADDLLDAVTRIDAIATALEHRMVHAHRVAELELARTASETAAQRLRRLLHGEPPDPPLDPSRRYHCAVFAVSDPAVAARVEPALSAAGLCGFVDGRLAAVFTRPPALPPDAPPNVVAPAVRPADLPGMYALASRTLRAAGQGGPLTSLALEAATGAEPAFGPLLAAELLGDLDHGEPFDRDLATTALAYLDNGCRVEATATALHVHPNTVKYRIRRLRERTGRPLPTSGPVTETVRWWWALRAWADAA